MVVSAARPDGQASPTEYPPVPARARSPQRLLLAGRKVFLAEGYQRTTIAAIAREARMSKATVYGHVASKSELFLAVSLDVMDEARAGLSEAFTASGPAAARPEDVADALLHLLPSLVDTCPLFFELWVLLSRDEELRGRCYGAFRSFYRDFAGVLAQVLERSAPGAYRPGEAEARGLAFIAALDGLCYQWLFLGDRVLLTRVGAAIRTMWVDSLKEPSAAPLAASGLGGAGSEEATA